MKRLHDSGMSRNEIAEHLKAGKQTVTDAGKLRNLTFDGAAMAHATAVAKLSNEQRLETLHEAFLKVAGLGLAKVARALPDLEVKTAADSFHVARVSAIFLDKAMVIRNDHRLNDGVTISDVKAYLDEKRGAGRGASVSEAQQYMQYILTGGEHEDNESPRAYVIPDDNDE
ncbi:hypothetical protein BJD99_01030 [Rhodococcus sp. 1163]|nr:hypothetical protein BJD99_01030 [Rhodococcus sp. 1163]